MSDAVHGLGFPDEPETERAKLTRNWNELLQEVRVVQTGVQILTGFLLTVPFSSRWDSLDDVQVAMYLCVLSGSVATTGFVLSPVAFHRLVFRRNQRAWLVQSGHHAAQAGLVLLGLTCAGVVALVFDVAVSRTVGLVAGIAVVVFFAILWGAAPALRRAQHEPN
ncbi:DUF6328 family protein [Nocardioides sp. GXZ039]|uniref:DUF6328 family protein n=1 Tax=Nocardioides sp. GXZ039 TaxID=3136018 RepID=UPI0030F3712A